MSHDETNFDPFQVEEVAQGGPGLAFIVYPRALTNLPAPNIWYIMFFGMILLMGVSSQTAETESMITMIVDLMPKFFNKHPRRSGSQKL